MAIATMPPLGESIDLRPLVRSPEQMDDLLEKLEFEGYERDRINAIGGSVDQQEELVKTIKKLDPTVNGNANELLKDLRGYQRETELEKTWWEKVKELPANVWDWTKRTIKAHPYITAGVVITALAVAAYYTGVGAYLIAPLQQWIASQPEGAVQRLAEEALKGVPSGPLEMTPGVSAETGLPLIAP